MLRAVFIAALVFGAACANTPERPRTEDDARQLAPLPACFVQLTQPSAGHASVSLREEQIWPLVFPSFDPKRGTLGPEDHACNGRQPLRDDVLTGGNAAKIGEGSIVMGGGGDRLKAAWLRAIDYPDGMSGGALVLLRTVNGTAEVYAIGSYRGRPKSVFTIERIGSEAVIVALDDGCKDRKGGACETTARVYRPRLGHLDRAAMIWPERIVYANDTEPGVRGKIEYRLSSSIQFLDGGIRVLEQVMVRDEAARELRKAEQERSFTFAPGNDSMVVDEDSLWTRVAPGQAKAKATTNAKPPPPSKEDDGG
jgi:hypothetical protein